MRIKMSNPFDLAQCDVGCRNWFARLPEKERAQVHREWHEARDLFAARELDFPFRRWYEQVSISDVEEWHAEYAKGQRIILRCQQIFAVPFGHGWLLRWLNDLVFVSVRARQARRDRERIAAMQKSH
jgi:hypothetical protein